SIRVGGDELDEAIINYVKREYKLLIGQQTAEEVKLEIGSAFPMAEEVQAEIRGRDMVSGLPKTVVLTSEEIRGALEEPVSQIVDAVKEALGELLQRDLPCKTNMFGVDGPRWQRSSAFP